MSYDMFDCKIEWLEKSDVKMQVALREIADNTDQFVTTSLKMLGERLRELIELYAPKKSGDYSKSWWVDEPQGNAIYIRTDDGLKARMLEFTGRRPSRIHGNPILHFQIAGQDIFVHWVDHPGFPAKPHIRRAMRQLQKEAPSIIYAALGKHVKIFKEPTQKYQTQWTRLSASRTVRRKSTRRRLRRSGTFRTQQIGS